MELNQGLPETIQLVVRGGLEHFKSRALTTWPHCLLCWADLCRSWDVKLGLCYDETINNYLIVSIIYYCYVNYLFLLFFNTYHIDTSVLLENNHTTRKIHKNYIRWFIFQNLAHELIDDVISVNFPLKFVFSFINVFLAIQYNKKDITQQLEDVNFVLMPKTIILYSLTVLVHKIILLCHWKVNFISSCYHVLVKSN